MFIDVLRLIADSFPNNFRVKLWQYVIHVFGDNKRKNWLTEQQLKHGILNTKTDNNNSIMVDWMLFIELFKQHNAILETMISEAVNNQCPNLCHQQNSMQLVLDQPCARPATSITLATI